MPSFAFTAAFRNTYPTHTHTHTHTRTQHTAPYARFPQESEELELLTAFLEEAFVDANNFAPYDTWIADHHLKPVFAKTKLQAGVGDAAQWGHMLGSAWSVENLRTSVVLEFPSTANKTKFGSADPVSILLDTKNVPELVVKVFEINTTQIARSGGSFNANMDLEGMEPNHEFRYTFFFFLGGGWECVGFELMPLFFWGGGAESSGYARPLTTSREQLFTPMTRITTHYVINLPLTLAFSGCAVTLTTTPRSAASGASFRSRTCRPAASSSSSLSAPTGFAAPPSPRAASTLCSA